MIRVVQCLEQTTRFLCPPDSIPALFVPRSDDIPVRGEPWIGASSVAEFRFKSSKPQEPDEIVSVRIVLSRLPIRETIRELVMP